MTASLWYTPVQVEGSHGEGLSGEQVLGRSVVPPPWLRVRFRNCGLPVAPVVSIMSPTLDRIGISPLVEIWEHAPLGESLRVAISNLLMSR